MTKKILLAEDDADIRFILDTVLRDAGYEVEPLPAGNSLVDRKHSWPDLFIIDMSLPVIDGFALCKYLRINRETKHIPIIMISSYHKLKGKANAVGADDFIEKPFNLQTLLDTVARHVTKAEINISR